ncbi:MAG: hexosyltransferase [Acidobacteria bacterium]|nr:MAG: hexosyltransferase [Acidobacteriota bacterium]
MKLACVIHRFGDEIAGGSENHCRLIAEHLAATHDVTILTTCARDHVGWENYYPAGESRLGPLTVLRFPVARQRNIHRFIDISDIVFSGRATPSEEEDWFRENGPVTPDLLDNLDRHSGDYDRVLFWSYRYFNSYFGLPLAADRAVLVPTAEEDPAIHISLLADYFARPAGFLFLTPEEQQLVGCRVPGTTPSAVIGCGIDPPPDAADVSRLEALDLADPFVLYLGRIDPNKGCRTLLEHFARYAAAGGTAQLVMAGPANMPVPDAPWIRRLGFVDAAVRDALLARARVLLMPSPFESLSMVLLEAWNRAVPALVNARCAVLRGQVLRADGGLYYRTAAEFVAALTCLLDDPGIATQFGRQGFAYVDREYRWPTVMGKVEALLKQARPKARASD